VNTIKEREDSVFVGVDAGFTHLIRPVLYNAYHHISKLESTTSNTQKYTIGGPLCESGDTFVKEFEMEELSEGELIVFHDVGAYGFSMASNYNSKGKAAEVLIHAEDEEAYSVIREKETLEDLLNHQKIPSHLK